MITFTKGQASIFLKQSWLSAIHGRPSVAGMIALLIMLVAVRSTALAEPASFVNPKTGAKYFPIGLWSPYPYSDDEPDKYDSSIHYERLQEHMPSMANAGFNLCYLWASGEATASNIQDITETLDVAQTWGVYGNVRIHDFISHQDWGDSRKTKLETLINAIEEHDALFCYDTCDELEGGSTNVLLQDAISMKDWVHLKDQYNRNVSLNQADIVLMEKCGYACFSLADPYDTTYPLNFILCPEHSQDPDCHRNIFEEWAYAADIFSMDIYPVGMPVHNANDKLNAPSVGFNIQKDDILTNRGNPPQMFLLQSTSLMRMLNKAPSPDCFIRVKDSANGSVLDTSDTFFTIASESGMMVTLPRGFETWTAGSPATVTWTSAGSVGNVDIDLSTDGGSNWTTLVSDTANDGTETITVPVGSSTTCRIRVQEPDGSPSDTSNMDFTITASPSITVTSPNGGETWKASSPATIKWISGGGVGNVRIDLSTNDGSSWTSLASNTANDGDATITVPSVSSTTCLVRVRAIDGSVSDVSRTNFEITNATSTVKVASPNGGETVLIDSPLTVTWTSTGSVANVDIELSANRGVHWTKLVSSATNDGSEDVTIPTTVLTDDAPTMEQTRFMVFDLITQGAKGIYWFGSMHLHEASPQWLGIVEVVGQIAPLADVLAAGTTVTSSATNGCHVICKEYDGEKYLIVTNTSETAQTGVLISSPYLAGQVQLLYEQRPNIPVVSRSFTDDFTGWGVHVYLEIHTADFNGDDDVDQEDFGFLQECLSGSGVSPAAGCEDADLDDDGDVDVDDFSEFQDCMNGPGQSPGC